MPPHKSTLSNINQLTASTKKPTSKGMPQTERILMNESKTWDRSTLYCISLHLLFDAPANIYIAYILQRKLESPNNVEK